MAEKTLEQRIEERKKQADDRKIYSKARTVAYYLGSGKRTDDDTDVTYNNDEFTIHHSNGWVRASDGDMLYFGATVTYKDEVVFKEGGGSISTYIPGTRTWEAKLDTLYAQAEVAAAAEKQKAQQKAAADKEREQATLAHKFGL